MPSYHWCACCRPYKPPVPGQWQVVIGVVLAQVNCDGCWNCTFYSSSILDWTNLPEGTADACATGRATLISRLNAREASRPNHNYVPWYPIADADLNDGWKPETNPTVRAFDHYYLFYACFDPTGAMVEGVYCIDGSALGWFERSTATDAGLPCRSNLAGVKPVELMPGFLETGYAPHQRELHYDEGTVYACEPDGGDCDPRDPGTAVIAYVYRFVYNCTDDEVAFPVGPDPSTPVVCVEPGSTTPGWTGVTYTDTDGKTYGLYEYTLETSDLCTDGVTDAPPAAPSPPTPEEIAAGCGNTCPDLSGAWNDTSGGTFVFVARSGDPDHYDWTYTIPGDPTVYGGELVCNGDGTLTYSPGSIVIPPENWSSSEITISSGYTITRV